MKLGEVIDNYACQAKYTNHHQGEAEKALCHAAIIPQGKRGGWLRDD